jgi:metal-responsive CopG/Arc/MetJ family transcriptional regulator
VRNRWWFSLSTAYSKISSILEYNCIVRLKTSVTLPDDLLEKIDRTNSNRSSFLEQAARQYLAYLERNQREKQDLAILNAQATSLNEEALDVLEYQDLG